MRNEDIDIIMMKYYLKFLINVLYSLQEMQLRYWYLDAIVSIIIIYPQYVMINKA